MKLSKLDLYAAKTLTPEINKFATSVYLRELAKLTYGKTVKSLREQVAKEQKLEGTVGHDANMIRLENLLAEAEEKYNSVLADVRYQFTAPQDVALRKAWKLTAEGMDGADTRIKLLDAWCHSWNIPCDGDLLRELERCLSYSVANNNIQEWWMFGASTKEAGLNLKTLYAILTRRAFELGLVKESACPDHLKMIWIKENMDAAVRKQAKADKKAAKAAAKAAKKAERDALAMMKGQI